MAIIPASRVRLLYAEGNALREGFYAVNNASTGDTVDLAGVFSFVKQAFVQGATVVGQEAVTTISGTVLTVPAAITNDSFYMAVQGDAGDVNV